MSDAEEDSDTIECATHGESTAAYLCGHLHWNPVQRWYGNPPAEDDRWPDAWCAKCEAAFQEAGEWNENNETAADIVMLCHHCYEDAQARSIDYLQGEALAHWEEFLGQCWDGLQAKQDRLKAEYQIDVHKRWDWDQETGELVFSNDGVPAVIAAIQFVGTLSTVSDTWLWSWANFHLLENVRRDMHRVRTFGEERGYPKLTVPKWNAEMADGWEMAAVAVHVLDAIGIYRTPGESGYAFLLITDIRFA